MTVYWVMVPALVALVGLAIELRTRRERQRFPFPERARMIHEALRRGVDVTVEFWSRSQNRYLKRALKPLELQGFYLRAIDKESGQEVSFKVTRLKKITLDRLVSSNAAAVGDAAEEVEELPPLPWERKRRRSRRRPLAQALILIGVSGTLIGSAALWLKSHRGVLRTEYDQDRRKFRDVEAVPVKRMLAEYAPPQPAHTTVIPTPTPLPARGVWNVMIATTEIQPRADVRQRLHEVFGYPHGVADKIADDLARRGKVAVWSGAFEQATNYLQRLKLEALAVSVEPHEAEPSAGVSEK